MPSTITNGRAFAAVLGFLLCALSLSVPPNVRAQGVDTALPPIETGELGQPQLVEVDVGPGVQPTSITLFYRFDGGRDRYADVAMRPTTRPGIYAATVQTRGLQATRLEYHIVAQTSDGRTLRRGDAGKPLVRELVSPAAPDPIVSSEPAAEESAASPGDDAAGDSSRRKYLYYALGALAVGAIAAAASADGGSDDDGGGCDGDNCELTLILTTPDP